MEYNGLTGKIVWPTDPEYDRARQEFNRAIDEYPLVIVYCENNQDVVNAILWAKKNKIGLRIRSGGHNYEGFSIGTGKVVIDMTFMNAVSVDTSKDIVTVQAGTRLGKLYKIISKYGYAFPGGTCPTVAISGLVLGGGVGLSTRYLGLTIDSLIEAEMVDANGNILIANSCCHKDLFWALKGAGGGNFGVITSFTFKLKKKVDKITLIQLVWNNNRKARFQFLNTWQKWLENLDSRISAFGRVYKEGALVNAYFYGKPEEAKKILEPFLDIQGITYHNIEYVSYIDAINIIGQMYPKSEKFKDTGRFVYEHFTEEKLSTLIDILDNAPNSYNSFIKVYSLGGMVKDIPKNGSAYFYRQAKYIIAISSDWENNDEALINKAWVAMGFKYLEKITVGSYVNFPYSPLNDYALKYYGQHLNTLQIIKERYDPDNVFKFPQSIKY